MTRGQQKSEVEPITVPTDRNFRIDEAIRKGLEQFNNEPQEENKFTITINREVLVQLRSLFSAFDSNSDVVITMAISYVLYYLDKQQKSLEEIITVMDKSEESANYKLYNYEIELSGITMLKLEKLRLKNRVNECAIAGIYLLYDNNCSFGQNGK